MANILKGVRFNGPDGQYYELVRDVHSFEMMDCGMFKAGGGAPEPKIGEKMPEWLTAQMRRGA